MEDYKPSFKHAVFYLLDVRSFFDADNDGVGDFRGLQQKLDYLQELGVTALCLFPFQKSVGRHGGFDISDHRAIDPLLGTGKEFRSFLREARRRGFRVMADFVAHCTSNEHRWFQRARSSPANSSARKFYLWRRGTEGDWGCPGPDWCWDEQARAYFRHAGHPDQPLLNYGHRPVVRAMASVLRAWLAAGIEGLRIHGLAQLRSSGEDEPMQPGLHVLRTWRAELSASFPDAVLIAAVDGWPDDLRQWAGNGTDGCHLIVNNPLVLRLLMAMRVEDYSFIRPIMEATPVLPEASAWALPGGIDSTLPVAALTDEEKDYCQRVFQGFGGRHPWFEQRLARLLGNRQESIRTFFGLLFSLPGVPCLYYGDEIGMGEMPGIPGAEALRAPMQWSAARNAGFSRAETAELIRPCNTDSDFGYTSVNVESQSRNPHSLLWWMIRCLSLRKRYFAFTEGDLKFIDSSNRTVLAYVRECREQKILVAVNLGRSAGETMLDLARYEACAPFELFGQETFDKITAAPYKLSLGPKSFVWLRLAEAELEFTRE